MAKNIAKIQLLMKIRNWDWLIKKCYFDTKYKIYSNQKNS